MVSRDLTVIARNYVDGFYYPGYTTAPHKPVDVTVDSEVLVNFWAIRPHPVPESEVIPIRGALPCPEPRKGTYVLVDVKCRSTQIECYLPGMVMGLPISLSIEHRVYTIILFNGNKLTKTRRNFVVIGRDQHDRIVSYIINQRKKRYEQMLLDGVKPALACERGKTARFRRRKRPFRSMSAKPRSRQSNSSKTSSVQSSSSVSTSSRFSVSRETQTSKYLDSLYERTPSISSSATSRTSTKVTSSSTSRTLTKVTPSSHSSNSLEKLDINMYTDDKRRILSPGNDVLARWPDDGWFYWGRVDGRASGTEDCYMVRDSTGFVTSIADEDLFTEEQQAFQAVQPKDFVIALHPGYVYSYAPAQVESTYTHGADVRFYDEEVCQRPWSELFQITEDKFKQCLEHIKQWRQQMASLSAIAFDGSVQIEAEAELGVETPAEAEVEAESETDKQQYFVPSYQSSYIKQKAIHIFPLKHMGVSSHQIPTCRYVLGPRDEQCTRYLAAQVHRPIYQRTEDNQETNTSLYFLTFCDGTQRSLDSLEKCFYLSENYFRFANSFYHHQTSQNRGCS